MASMNRKWLSFEAKHKVIEAVEKGDKTLLVCVCMSVISCSTIAQNRQRVESLWRGKTTSRDKRTEKDRDRVEAKWRVLVDLVCNKTLVITNFKPWSVNFVLSEVYCKEKCVCSGWSANLNISCSRCIHDWIFGLHYAAQVQILFFIKI